MMSAHDVAVAALNEVASHQRSEQRDREIAPPSLTNEPTATSIEAYPTNDASRTERQEANAFIGSQPSSTNNSQDTVPDTTTPPTSDDFSSQSHQSPSRFSQIPLLAEKHQNPTQGRNVPLPKQDIATNAGQKRTIDGYAKPSVSGSNSSASPSSEVTTGHSRNASNASAASVTLNSRELVSELRTRLSYAMVKVNKGWESLPIDEIESLTSHAGSPSSSTSTIHPRQNALTSPRTALANIQGQSRDMLLYESMTRTTTSPADAAQHGDGQPSRTYESFWREQSQRSVPASSSYASPNPRNIALAPPADIKSAIRPLQNARRSHTPKLFKPPTLPAQSSSEIIQSSHLTVGLNTSSPRTPNRNNTHTSPMLDNTNQKSLQERDAIETLLFMSSPGNSSTMGHTFPPPGQLSQQPSPLRAEFGPQLRTPLGRSVETRGMKTNATALSRPSRPFIQPDNRPDNRIRLNNHPGRPGDDAYDRMLDDMADTDSSDDEIEIPITPRRLAASRT